MADYQLEQQNSFNNLENINVKLESERQTPEHVKPEVFIEEKDLKQAPVVETKSKTWFERICPCLSIEAYQCYFDLNTGDFLKRLGTSLIPFNKRFY